MLPVYVVHSMEGRARLRHPALGEVVVRAAAQAALGKEPGVDEVRPGAESLLLLLQPGADVAEICARLEKSVPALARPLAWWRRKGALRLVLAGASSGGGAMPPVRLPARASVPRLHAFARGVQATSATCWVFRAVSLRYGAMLGVAGLCLASGLAGPKPVHLVAGLAWALMAGRHVWVRRKAV